MKTRPIITFSLSVLILGGAVAGYTGNGFTAFAGTRETSKAAEKEFDAARKNLSKGNVDAAVKQAEAAVGYDPEVASYRLLLGQAYLKAGRFTSAQTAFSDALTLDPANGKAALNLALTEIANGNWDGARRTLDANSSTIAVSDRGLAIALAGDPAAAIEVLDAAARAPEADAKTRQNYALALALGGRWSDAKTVVAMDVAPDQVDARVMQWATFAKPVSASDQVASLLGVTPVEDTGQPARLALNGRGAVGLAAAQPVDTFMPKAQPEAVAVAADMRTPVTEAAAKPVDFATAPPAWNSSVSSEIVAAAVASVSFAPRQEVVQAVPVRAVRTVPAKVAPGMAITKPRPAVTAVATPKPAVGAAKPAIAAIDPAPVKGNFFVQLGAFENAAVAKDAWGRVTRSHPGFAGREPTGTPITTKGGTFYRLSVGGFARGDANALCNGYKAKGGKCFVRTGAGDKTAAWVKPAGKLASR